MGKVPQERYPTRIQCNNNKNITTIWNNSLNKVSVITGADGLTVEYLCCKKSDKGNVLESYVYTYDYNGSQLTKTENGITLAYTYDKLNRLIFENDTTYTYDEAGNRLSKSDGIDTITYEYDSRNRLTSEGMNGIITTYSYDNNGNLLAKSDGTQYTYDGFNRLVEIRKQDGTTQQNIYDASGNRMATVENGVYTEYIFDRGILLQNMTRMEIIKRAIRGEHL